MFEKYVPKIKYSEVNWIHGHKLFSVKFFENNNTLHSIAFAFLL